MKAFEQKEFCFVAPPAPPAAARSRLAANTYDPIAASSPRAIWSSRGGVEVLFFTKYAEMFPKPFANTVRGASKLKGELGSPSTALYALSEQRIIMPSLALWGGAGGMAGEVLKPP